MVIDVLKTNLKLSGQGVRVRLPPFASAVSFDKTNTFKSRVNKCWRQNVKNLKYVYFPTSTNTTAQIFAKKVQQKSLQRCRGASSSAAATPTPTMVDVHWPDDAAVVSVADTQIQQIQMLTNTNTT